jgi:hypothetical protein
MFKRRQFSDGVLAVDGATRVNRNLARPEYSRSTLRKHFSAVYQEVYRLWLTALGSIQVTRDCRVRRRWRVRFRRRSGRPRSDDLLVHELNELRREPPFEFVVGP